MSFTLTLLYATFVGQGGEAMGIGMLWYYSLPALIIVSILIALATLNWYQKVTRARSKGVRLFFLSLTVSIASPLLTYLIFWIRV
jgi:hypothetical protein